MNSKCQLINQAINAKKELNAWQLVWIGCFVSFWSSAPDLWDVFMSILYTAIDLYIPQRAPLNSTAHRKPYLRSTRELCKCLIKKRHLWRKLRINKHDTAIRLKYRECVHQWRHLIQQQQEKTEEHLIEANSIGSLYKFVNKRISSRTGIPPLTNNNNDKLVTIIPRPVCLMIILPV